MALPLEVEGVPRARASTARLGARAQHAHWPREAAGGRWRSEKRPWEGEAAWKGAVHGPAHVLADPRQALRGSSHAPTAPSARVRLRGTQEEPPSAGLRGGRGRIPKAAAQRPEADHLLAHLGCVPAHLPRTSERGQGAKAASPEAADAVRGREYPQLGLVSTRQVY